MPSRRVARSSAAPELGALGKRGRGSGEESGAGLGGAGGLESWSGLGVPTGVLGVLRGECEGSGDTISKGRKEAEDGDRVRYKMNWDPGGIFSKHSSIVGGQGRGGELPKEAWMGAGVCKGTPRAPVFLQLRDCGGLREVEVTACLVWKDWPHRVHPHSLVGKDCTDGVCRVRLRPHVSPRHSFNNLGIQSGSLKNHQEVDMNVVRICFQASYRDQQGQMRRMDPVLSEPVYDKKSTNTSELRICRINKESGPCTGGEELYLLCDKVQKEDISVVFSRASWEGRADFSQADVHRQIAIVFKTPPYEDLEIVEPVTVNVFLQRLTDGVCSEPLPFTYLPRDHDSYGVDKKRKRGLPDVLGELNSSDPHGIESKRRRKKPAFLDHFLPGHGSGPFLPPSALLPDTDFFPGTVAVTGNGGAGAAVGEPPGPEPLTLDSYQSPGPGDGGTASLVGSNMFPNQYREAGFGGGLLSPGPEAT
ncbi:hypothetical protein E2I00_009949 [Balaenoptera physalus]|uniref:RHD domain-containing protein n=1 Tax=Balaenoptera physalus TaxID=9770 RepID=A0A643CFL6_BALPH|nr:hypothetical protein E2I00_009949 [Balaenoptera physalus]